MLDTTIYIRGGLIARVQNRGAGVSGGSRIEAAAVLNTIKYYQQRLKHYTVEFDYNVTFPLAPAEFLFFAYNQNCL